MKKKEPIIKLRLPGSLYQRILADLKRQHAFAYERVGFAFGQSTLLTDQTLLINFTDYKPVEDQHYIKDDTVGARIGGTAIRNAMQMVMNKNCSGFHVHLHNHKGQPWPSGDDKEGLPGIIESLSNGDPNQPHGVLILSKDSFYAWVKIEDVTQFVVPEIITAVRSQLEAECRRYLLPYVDIGMDVYKSEEGFQISGQLILSMPGQPCMRCMGFITEDKLAKEAAKYGKAGGRPQVIWPNGLLASSAIGIFTDLVIGWSCQKDRLVYMAYDGNSGTIQKHVRLDYLTPTCPHYDITQVGPPKFKKL